MFNGLNPCVQGCSRIAWLHLDAFLEEYRACVDACIDEMNRAAAHLNAGIDRLLWGANPRKGWAESRVGVEDSTFECLDKERAKNSHESSKHNTFNVMFSAG